MSANALGDSVATCSRTTVYGLIRLACLHTRPAAREPLESGIAIGVPSYLPSSAASGAGLYFVSVVDAAALSAASSTGSYYNRSVTLEGLCACTIRPVQP